MQQCEQVQAPPAIHEHCERVKEQRFSDWDSTIQLQSIKDFTLLRLRIDQAVTQGGYTLRKKDAKMTTT